MADCPASDDLARELRAAWFGYLDGIEPIRPALHRYCRRLTGRVWDAEDLAQEALLRGFATIGRGDLDGAASRVGNLRGYLFRTATNIWIDSVRHRAFEEPSPAPIADASGAPDDPLATRDAGAALLERVAPRERAAIVLKDVFDFTLEEIADMLSTTVGAVKSALHRGRQRLREPVATTPASSRRPSVELVDRFVDAFNARDVSRLTALLLEHVEVRVPGVGGERGWDTIWVRSSMFGYPGPDGGLRRVERRTYAGEPIVVLWRDHGAGEAMEEVWRFEEEDGSIARIRDYCYCPETLAAVAADLGLPLVARGYHQPPDALARMIASATLPWVSRE